jgi:muramoyltetrapeptide carboxypeptidase
MKTKALLTLIFSILAIGIFFILSSFENEKNYQSIQPAFLKKGDTIAIVATARKHPDTLMLETKALLESWGLHVKIGKSIGLSHHQLAGTDQERANDFQTQLDDPSIKAIWCVRGGYGTVRMIDLLDFSKFLKKPKWVIGFSDVTVLHAHINNMHIQTLHAIMPLNLKKATEDAKNSLFCTLFGEPLYYNIPTDSLNVLGEAKGILVGGNLSILYNLSGTTSMPDYNDKILYIEDLDEYLYHVDRMMMNLERTGALKQIKGLVVGGMTQMKDNSTPWGKDAYGIIQNITKKYNIPTIYHFPAGHIDDNRALILGRPTKIKVEKNQSELIFL